VLDASSGQARQDARLPAQPFDRQRATLCPRPLGAEFAEIRLLVQKEDELAYSLGTGLGQKSGGDLIQPRRVLCRRQGFRRRRLGDGEPG
jgi:hypothetical protein